MAQEADNTLGALTAQRDELDRLINEMKERDRAGALETVLKKIALFQLTAADLGFGGKPGRQPKQQATRASVAPKYRDPETGATWSGRGKPPKWIAFIEDRTRFLI
ncbi:H-NS histone family protein [Robbsia andropogonis]|uniref:H-NS histone family protein n=1 Tax=Robbsia andropogonis TaxID=28092 RepID=UPI002A6AD690|nr:H-NS histone family protein [Robbsia andropogonis]